MEGFDATLARIDSLCKRSNLDYIVIGGVAVMYYESARQTTDIDLSVDTEIGEFNKVVNIFTSNGFRAVKENPLVFFERYFVLPLIDDVNGIKVDVAAGVGGFEKLSISRGKRVTFGNAEFNIATPEDMLIFKLFAARERDIADVKYLIRRFRKQLSIPYLKSTAKKFQELERGDILENLNRFLGE
ncbi:MAG: nucleotidyltransferase [Chloroherpetonaceae bacterium]|nr:nucleotidyltransferase [Chloroherpetonaceae bacterium]